MMCVTVVCLYMWDYEGLGCVYFVCGWRCGCGMHGVCGYVRGMCVCGMCMLGGVCGVYVHVEGMGYVCLWDVRGGICVGVCVVCGCGVWGCVGCICGGVCMCVCWSVCVVWGMCGVWCVCRGVGDVCLWALSAKAGAVSAVSWCVVCGV